jgi:hypothetical protein
MRSEPTRRRLVGRAAIATLLALAAAVSTATAAPPPDAARSGHPWPCLPPVFDRGERLHSLPAPSVFWLELLLRQHEICRRWNPGEVRILLAGSSGVFGYPLPADQTFAHLLNEHFDAAGVPAHVFNLAFVNPYQVRDAVIIDEARRFAPDIILYPVTLAEFDHICPSFFLPVMRFFDTNRRTVARLAEEPPSGLEEPVRKYAAILSRPSPRRTRLDYLYEAGGLLHSGLRTHARALAAAFGSTPSPLVPPRSHPQDGYDCSKTHEIIKSRYSNWQDWNILAYLDELRRTDGVDVVVVYWPIAHDPVGDCYSVRYTDDSVVEFAHWLHDDTAKRGLPYVDLHGLLPSELFVDSLHVSAEGHQRIAAALARVLDPIVANRLARCRLNGIGCSAADEAQN